MIDEYAELHEKTNHQALNECFDRIQSLIHWEQYDAVLNIPLDPSDFILMWDEPPKKTFELDHL